MVVHENHGGGRFADHRIVNLAWVDERSGKRAFGDFDLADLAVLIVEQHNVKLFALFPAEIFSEVLIYFFGGMKWLAGLPFLAADAFADFQASFELRHFGRADAFNSANFTDRCIVDAFETTKLIEQQARVVDGALAGASVAVSENDREQFGFSQRVGTLGEKFFSWPIFFGPIFDGLIGSHGHLACRGRDFGEVSGRDNRLTQGARFSPLLSRQDLLNTLPRDDAG